MNRRGRPPHPDILTPREWQVLELLRAGMTNQEIAARLGISADGAKYHVSEIISKLGVSGRREAAAWARSTVRRRPALAALFGSLAGRLGFGATAVVALVGIAVLAWGLLTVKRGAVDLGLRPGVYVFEPRSGHLTRVAESPQICQAQCGPAYDLLSWSPKGDELLINDSLVEGRGVLAAAVDGTSVRSLPLKAWELSWLSSGDLAGHARLGQEPDSPEAAVIFDSTTGTPLTTSYGNYGALAFTANGDWVLGTSREGGPGLDLIQPSSSAVRRLLNGNFSYPAWAPSGASFAVNVINEASGRLELATYSRDGSMLARAIAGQRPVWSPDGGLIATTDYRQVESGQEPWILLFDPLGRNPPRDLAQGESPEFAPDSKSLAFIRDGELLDIGINGTGERKLVSTPLPMIAEAHWSLDGKRIAFIAGGGGGMLYTIGADGTGEHVLAPGYGAVPSPDGSRVAFFFGGFSGSTIFTLNVKTSDIARVARAGYSDAIAPCTSGPNLSWSPDSRQIAYWTYDFIDPPITGGVIHAWDGKQDRRMANGYGPTWLPDGKAIAYTSPAFSRAAACSTSSVPASGGDPQELIAGALSASWTKDGKYVAYIASMVAGPVFGDLTIASGDGKTVIKRLGPSRGLSWSADGAHYAFVRSPGRAAPPDSRIFEPAPPVVPPDGTVFLVIGSMTPGEADIEIPVLSFSDFAWSPDGLKLAYTSRRGPQAPSDIFVMEVAHPQSPRHITSGNNPRWLDDRTLVFSR